MNATRRAALDHRFACLLTAWLASLPNGWEGTPRQLADALMEVNASGRFFALVPRSGLPAMLRQHADTLDEAGWQVTQRRTGTARLITITKLAR